MAAAQRRSREELQLRELKRGKKDLLNKAAISAAIGGTCLPGSIACGIWDGSVETDEFSPFRLASSIVGAAATATGLGGAAVCSNCARNLQAEIDTIERQLRTQDMPGREPITNPLRVLQELQSDPVAKSPLDIPPIGLERAIERTGQQGVKTGSGIRRRQVNPKAKFAMNLAIKLRKNGYDKCDALREAWRLIREFNL